MTGKHAATTPPRSAKTPTHPRSWSTTFDHRVRPHDGTDRSCLFDLAGRLDPQTTVVAEITGLKAANE